MRWRLSLPTLGARDRRALRLGAWLVLPSLVIALGVRPWSAALLQSRESLARERTLLARERVLVAGAARDRALLASARRVLDAASPRLFGGAEAVMASAELARYAGGLAVESGLQLDQSETEAALDAPDADRAPGDSASRGGADSAVRPLRVVIRAHGSIVDILDFLRAVEDGPRQVRIERITISRAAGDGESDDGTLAFSATVSGLPRAGFVSPGTAADSPRLASTNGDVGGGER